MASFTVQFEIGPETRKLIERIADKSAIQIELGPQTLETVREVLGRESSGGRDRAGEPRGPRPTPP